MSNTTTAKAPEFTGMRARLWPIHSVELKKFLPLAFIMFCFLFIYTVLRDTKDTLVVSSAGAGVIPFIKTFVVTPAAIIFVIIYAKLSNVLSREALFYAIVTPFLIFFGSFAFIIYPNLSHLHMSVDQIKDMQAAYPSLSGFIAMYGYWAFSLFYVMAEIWGSAMIALVFWQFANEVTRLHESKRFYGMFGVIANVALIFSGQAVKFFSDIKKYYPEGTDVWQISLNWLMGCVVIMGIVSMLIYRWMNKNVLTNPFYYEAAAVDPTKKKKKKPGLMESAKVIFTSPYLGLIALLIMAYGVTINLVEVQWKNQMALQYPIKNDLNAFMGNYSTFSGLVTICFMLFIGNSILRKTSWFTAAVITPAFTLVAGVLFFMFVLGKDAMEGVLENLGMTAVFAAAMLGVFIVGASKAVKYGLFDPTKEMAYIPLDAELKSKGKAAVDVIGGRAGKAGGGLIQTMLFSIMATMNPVVIAPYSFVIFAVVCVAWLVAVKALSRRVDAAVAEREAESKAA